VDGKLRCCLLRAEKLFIWLSLESLKVLVSRVKWLQVGAIIKRGFFEKYREATKMTNKFLMLTQKSQEPWGIKQTSRYLKETGWGFAEIEKIFKKAWAVRESRCWDYLQWSYNLGEGVQGGS